MTIAFCHRVGELLKGAQSSKEVNGTKIQVSVSWKDPRKTPVKHLVNRGEQNEEV